MFEITSIHTVITEVVFFSSSRRKETRQKINVLIFIKINHGRYSYFVGCPSRLITLTIFGVNFLHYKNKIFLIRLFWLLVFLSMEVNYFQSLEVNERHSKRFQIIQ